MCVCAYMHMLVLSLCTLIHFYIQYIDILASNERNYQYESVLFMSETLAKVLSLKKMCVFLGVCGGHGWNYVLEIC